jgi:hypothetical protein
MLCVAGCEPLVDSYVPLRSEYTVLLVIDPVSCMSEESGQRRERTCNKCAVKSGA